MHGVFGRIVPPVLMLIGCSGPVSVDGSSDAVVAGVVLRASGQPVASAAISMLVTDSAGSDTLFNEPGGPTDGTGHFSTHLGAPLTPAFTGRVQITVGPPVAEQLSDTTVDAGFLRFGLQPPATSNTIITYP